MWMADGRLDAQWDQVSAVLAQLANIGAFVFRTDKKVYQQKDWNPRRRVTVKKRELDPGGMEVLKHLVLSGQLKATIAR